MHRLIVSNNIYNMHLENKWVEFSFNVDFNFSETWLFHKLMEDFHTKIWYFFCLVNEEKLRKQIREDLQKLLNEEMKMAEHNMRQE